MSTRYAGTDNAPNFVVLVQSSLSVIVIAITAPDVIRTSGPFIENCGASELSKASVAPRTIFPRSALVQTSLQKETSVQVQFCSRGFRIANLGRGTLRPLA